MGPEVGRWLNPVASSMMWHGIFMFLLIADWYGWLKHHSYNSISSIKIYHWSNARCLWHWMPVSYCRELCFVELKSSEHSHNHISDTLKRSLKEVVIVFHPSSIKWQWLKVDDRVHNHSILNFNIPFENFGTYKNLLRSNVDVIMNTCGAKTVKRLNQS